MKSHDKLNDHTIATRPNLPTHWLVQVVAASADRQAEGPIAGHKPQGILALGHPCSCRWQIDGQTMFTVTNPIQEKLPDTNENAYTRNQPEKVNSVWAIVTPSESDLCKFQRFLPNPHRND